MAGEDVQNAFEDPEKVPDFERMQRNFSQEQVDDIVKNALADLPPDANERTGIENNVERLKKEGLWATARFYETLLRLDKPTEG